MTKTQRADIYTTGDLVRAGITKTRDTAERYIRLLEGLTGTSYTHQFGARTRFVLTRDAYDVLAQAAPLIRQHRSPERALREVLGLPPADLGSPVSRPAAGSTGPTRSELEAAIRRINEGVGETAEMLSSLYAPHGPLHVTQERSALVKKAARDVAKHLPTTAAEVKALHGEVRELRGEVRRRFGEIEREVGGLRRSLDSALEALQRRRDT